MSDDHLMELALRKLREILLYCPEDSGAGRTMLDAARRLVPQDEEFHPHPNGTKKGQKRWKTRIVVPKSHLSAPSCVIASPVSGKEEMVPRQRKVVIF